MPAEAAPQVGAFGIKRSLILAFAIIAGMTAIASAVAWYVFTDIDRAVTRIIDRSVPDLVGAHHLAVHSVEIAAAAPALMASASDAERVRLQSELEKRAEALIGEAAALAPGETGDGTGSELGAIALELTDGLRDLSRAVQRRLASKARREATVERLNRVHTKLLDTLEPLVDDAVFDLVIEGETFATDSGNALTELIGGGVTTLRHLLVVEAEAHRSAGLLDEAARADSTSAIESIQKRFAAAATAIGRSSSQLPDTTETERLRQSANALLRLGSADGNLFALRREELRAGGDARAELRQRREAAMTEVEAAHDTLLAVVEPMIDAARTDIVNASSALTTANAAVLRELLDVGVMSLKALLAVRAEGNLAAGLLNEASNTLDDRLLPPLEERFVAAVGRIERELRQLQTSPTVDALHAQVDDLVAFGQGDADLFDLRREELRHAATAEKELATSQDLAVRLGDEVAGLVTAAQRASDAAADRSAEAIEHGRLVLLVIAAISVAGAIVVVVRHVVPNIVRPLDHITSAMTALATGDTTVDIPGRDRRDEIGRMAAALGVFRDTAIELQESNLRELDLTRRRLSDAIESITEGFSLYDHSDRLVVCNTRYRTLLYLGMENEVRPGTTFESIAREAAERGYVKEAEGRVDAWVAERMARHRDPGPPHVQQRGDGRWILISERRTEEGGTVAVYSDITELKQREQELAAKSRALEVLSNQLAKYLSPQVYESIFTGKQEVKIASKRKKLTVFFSDIAGFTETVERMESEDLTYLLNNYLTEMSRIALRFGATIDKYIGDAIVIFFGDPDSRGVKQDAIACVEMAIAMRERLRELEVAWRDAGIETPLRCRIGINTGYCTVGNFGSEDRMDYTIIGGGVNLASRLESAAAPGEILISYEAWAHVRDEIHCEEQHSITVKGIAHPIATYQVVDRYDKLEHALVRQDLPHLKIHLDLDTLSTDDRHQVMAALRHTLDRLSSFEQGGVEMPRPADLPTLGTDRDP